MISVNLLNNDGKMLKIPFNAKESHTLAKPLSIFCGTKNVVRDTVGYPFRSFILIILNILPLNYKFIEVLFSFLNLRVSSFHINLFIT